ncbi:DUF1853 family protein [Endozoicomonas ascidiicola]|uniref:DUF1853 family protein n=1 Tax=Endozoicomonas ascidiicola TaxID=1698521 RepID=UPI000830EBE9|nr:DUF1853 family protein [Endozoicomonas ascidiicola]
MHEFSHQILKHTLHQALHWIQSAPPIFCSDAHPLCVDHVLPGNLSLLTPTEKQLEKLASQVQNKSNPLLGILYETLWQFLVDELSETELLAHNLQVYSSDRLKTIGEFDLLYQHHQRTVHRELAVKFYLGLPCNNGSLSGSNWSNWVGPGLRDRLDIKMHRLIHHQISLSNSTEGRATLAAKNIKSSNIRRELLIQGRLFYPLASETFQNTTTRNSQTSHSLIFYQQPDHLSAALCPPPQHCRPDHLRGYWMTLGQMEDQQALFRDSHFQLLSKYQWLSSEAENTQHRYKDIQNQLAGLQRPIYLRASHPESSLPVDLFIVPDDWPERAIQYAGDD